MDAIKDFLKGILTPIAEFLKLPVKTVGFMGLGIIAVIILAIVISAVCTSKNKKRAKAKAVEAAKQAAKKRAEEQAVIDSIRKTAVKEEEVNNEEEKIEVENEPQPIEETKETEKIEEPKEVEIETKPVVEEKPVKPVKKAEAKKPAEKKTETTEEKKPTKKLGGKWLVEIKNENEYLSKLLASNGEVMLVSETYTTEEGARNGIATIIKGVSLGNFVIYEDKNKNYYYKLKTVANRLLCVGEIYKSKDQCVKAVETVKRIASVSAVSSVLIEGSRYIPYTPETVDTEGKIKGKWKIETTENGNFSARLYANNGQLMLATEEVSLKKSAENAINSVKKNAAEGNFVIDKDKSGRYYYKLRNAQKSLICIGEAYESLESCTNAIESVRRFAANSTIA